MPPYLNKVPSKLALYSHSGQLKSQHAKEFFKNNPTIDAAYVITAEHTPNFHYIHRVDEKIHHFPVDSVDTLVEELECVEQYKAGHQVSGSFLIPAVQDRHLQIIQDKTGHVHYSGESRELVLALKKFERINDFSSRHYDLYQSAIKAYQEFIKGYLNDVLTALTICPGAEFYRRDFFTLAKLDKTAAQQQEEAPDNLILQLSNFMSQFGDSIDNTSDKIKQKLVHGKEQVSQLLSDPNLHCIIHGIYKLEWLLSLPKQRPCWSELVEFDADFHSGKNLFVDFLLKITAESRGLNQEEIKRNLRVKGTGKQQALIAALKIECQGYLDYLEEKLQVNLAPNQDLPAAYERMAPILYSKHRVTHNLLKILSNEETTASAKISKFRENFPGAKEALSKHRDTPTVLFLKRTAYVLSSLLLGAGLIYSYVSNGSCNFFKSKGELAADKIEAYLPRPEVQGR